MATITNVNLNIQQAGAQPPAAPRTVTVTYSVQFSLAEIQAQAFFISNIRLVPMEGAVAGNPIVNIATESIIATNVLVVRTVSSTFTRSTLDEDPDSFILQDHLGHPFLISVEREDAWRARVTLTPVVQTVSRNSQIVTGSWGSAGDD